MDFLFLSILGPLPNPPLNTGNIDPSDEDIL